MIGGISTNNLLIHLDGIKNQGLSLEHFITSTQWKNLANEDEVKTKWAVDGEYNPKMAGEDRDALYAGWQKAVGRSLDWENK